MLRFDNFKSVFPADILKRGRDYYRKHHIRDLAYDDEEAWSAQVDGSEVYDVEIIRQEDGTLDCSCTCPYAETDLCKHMAAVLYAIEADFPEVIGKKKSSGTKAKPTKKDTLRRALEAASHEELVKMLLDWAEADRSMTDQLLLRLGAKGDKAADYAAMVKAALRVGKGEYGYVDRSGANRIARQLDLIIGQGNDKLREGQIRVAIAIFQAVLDTTLDALEKIEMADSIVDALHEALVGLRRCGSEMAPTARREVIDALLKYAANPFMTYIEWSVGPYELAADLVETPEDQDRVLTAFKKSRRGGGYGGYASHVEQQTAELELRIIKRLGSDADVERFVQSHSHLPSFGIELIRRAIAKKDFVTAKQLIEKGKKNRSLPPANVMGFFDYVDNYDLLALDIAKEEQDKPQIIALTRQMWLTGHRQEDYVLLKATVEPEKWPAFADGLLKEARQPELRAWIYHQEKRWRELFDVVRQHPTYLLKSYQQGLEEHFPDEMAKFYERTVFNMMQTSTNREAYKTAAGLIARIRIVGDEDRAEEIIALLRAEYPRRRALMEELDQI